MVICLSLLILSGIVLWRPYFAGFFAISGIRIAAVVHMLSAFFLIVACGGPPYAAIWVKGSVRAMDARTVSHGLGPSTITLCGIEDHGHC